MAEATGIDASIAASEAAKSSEKRAELKTHDTRENVINTFKFAYSQLESQPDDSLDPNLRWLKNKALKNAKEQTIDQDKDSLEVRFANHHTGEEFTQQEGIPVNKLIEFLREKSKSLPKGSEERKKLREAAKILFRNSKLYRRLPHRMEPNRLLGRVHYEAQLVSMDSDRATGSMDGDWYEAEKDLINRRELILPPPVTGTTAIPEAATPETGTPAVTTTAEAGITTPTTRTPPTTPAETEGPKGSDTTPLEEVRREFAIINRSVDIKKRARELAEEQLRNEMRRGSAWNPLNWPRKVALRVAEEFYRQRFIERASRAMIDHNNSYLEMDVVKNALTDANNQITEERAAGQAKIEQVKTQVKEGISLSGQRLGQEIQEAQGGLKDAIIGDILRPIVEGRIGTQAQVQDALRRFVQNNQADAQVQAIFGRNATQFGNLADYFASDLLEMGQLVKQDLDAHKYAMEQLNEVVKIQLANTSWAAETESQLNNTTDKVVAWAERNRLRGWLVNPATIGAALSIATYGFQRTTGIASGAANFIAPGVGLIAGAGFAAFRRNYDLKIDRASHQVERTYNRQIGLNSPRRDALERFQYSTTTVGNLLNNLENTQKADLSASQQTNREGVARAIAEISTRLDFSAREKVDLITYKGREQVEQSRLELIRSVVGARKALRDVGMTSDEITQLENRFTAEWNQQFTQNREQQDRAFARYRLRNSLGAGVFGGAVGLASGLLVQEGIALTQRGAGMNVGQTAIEKGLSVLGIGGAENQPISPSGFHSEATRELFRAPGNLKINDHVTLAASPNILEGNVRGVTMLVDGQPQGPTMFLTEQGTIVSSGTVDNIPDGPLKETLGGLTNHEISNPNVNTYQAVEGYLTIGEHKTFIRGDFIFDLNSGPDGQMSFQHYPTQTGVHGFAHLVDGKPVIDIDTTFAENPELSNEDWNLIRQELEKDGWGVRIENIPGEVKPGATVLDSLLESPDKLKQQGIVETDQFKKSWNFHVLRPDIVSATGMHTHNELTMHLGGEYQVAPHRLAPNGELRHGSPGLNPGELKFTGKIPGLDEIVKNNGGLIPSNLLGIPPEKDPVLNALIQKEGGLRFGDMVFVVELTNDKQLMITSNALGNAKLPPELYDQSTGNLRGVESITSALIQKPDGNVLRAPELLQTGEIPNGSVVHSLASERFLPGELPSLPPEPKDIYHLIPPTATEYVPPAPPPVMEQYDAPIIPIPFAPRHPLEAMNREILLPPSIYGGKPREEILKILGKNRSETLKSNPNAVLDSHKEVQMYFDKQESRYVSELQELANQITESPSDNLRAIVCIPVAGHQEEGSIYNTLFNYTYQDAPKDQYEILLFVNNPVTDKNGKPLSSDKTLAEIARFKTDHPDIPVRVVHKTFPLNQVNIGNIRKYGTDIALLRNNQRGPDAPDIVLISNDADLKGIAPTYISNFIQRFDKDPEVDGMLGQLDWDPEAYTKYPLLHVGTRLFQYLTVIGRHKSGRMPSSGANFAFKGSIYAAIGGYIPDAAGGEDIAVGWGIIEGRQNPNRIKFGGARVSRLYTSARRAIHALQEGIAPINQWEKGFSAFDDEIRKIQSGTGTDINYDDKTQIAQLKVGLEQVINQTLDSYEAGEKLGKNSPFYRQALRYLGIQYQVKNGQVVITNMDPLIRGLKTYKQIGVILRDIKSGKGTPEMKARLKELENQYEQQLSERDRENTETTEQQSNQVDQKIEQLNVDKLAIPDIPSLKYTLEDLKSSADMVELQDYTICRDKPLGSGQMGEVVAGFNNKTGELLAFKRINQDEQRFIAKANQYPPAITDIEDVLISTTESPRLGIYTDKIETEDSLIKIYPLESTDLEHYLEAKKKLEPAQALAISIRVANALRELHKLGIVHLDLSPTNILLSKDVLKLSDFGAASIRGADGQFHRGFTGGFRYMMPPELFQENAQFNESADTYEATILLYKLITGAYPYHSGGGTNEERTENLYQAHLSGAFQIPNEMPAPIKNILQKGIQPDPANRYQNTTELLNDLIDAYNQLNAPINQKTAP